MKKVKFNAIVDIFLAIFSLASAFSGFVLWKILPSSGFRGGRGLSVIGGFLSLDRHIWLKIHNFTSLAVVILVLVHLILHWQLIKGLPKLLKS